MRELTVNECSTIEGGALPAAVYAVAKVISAVGGVAGIAAWILE